MTSSFTVEVRRMGAERGEGSRMGMNGGGWHGGGRRSKERGEEEERGDKKDGEEKGKRERTADRWSQPSCVVHVSKII